MAVAEYLLEKSLRCCAGRTCLKLPSQMQGSIHRKMPRLGTCLKTTQGEAGGSRLWEDALPVVLHHEAAEGVLGKLLATGDCWTRWAARADAGDAASAAGAGAVRLCVWRTLTR